MTSSALSSGWLFFCFAYFSGVIEQSTKFKQSFNKTNKVILAILRLICHKFNDFQQNESEIQEVRTLLTDEDEGS